MFLTPEEIIVLFQNKKIDRSSAIEFIISMINNCENEDFRIRSINSLSELNLNDSNIYSILENLLISDPNENVRYAAINALIANFSGENLTPFLWALRNEPCYECLIKIIEALKKINTKNVKNLFLKYLQEISHSGFRKSIEGLITTDQITHYSNEGLANLLINYFTLFFLEKKFQNLKYGLKEGLIKELDFSEINSPLINWRQKSDLLDLSEISGIRYLKDLNSLKLFSLKWTIQNEICCNCQLTLLKAINYSNEERIKKDLFSHVKKIKDEIFIKGIEQLIRENKDIEEIPNSDLINILINFYLSAFLKKKYPKITYKVEKGFLVGLVLERSHLITIPDFIQYFESLEYLVLKSCKIYNLPDSIINLKKIEELNLEGNYIQELPNKFGFLPSLKNLNLSRNKLKSLPKTINSLANLESLNLESNNLAFLPEEIGELHLLKNLNLSKNYLKELPDSVCNLKHLKLLSLNFNRIIRIPINIGQLTELKVLNLNNNFLTELPKSIKNLIKLEFLYLANNRLEHISESICLIRTLEYLDISYNKIKSIPTQINLLKSLKILHLSHNNLKTIPESMGLLSKLEHLDISGNFLETLPKMFCRLMSLKTIELHNNLLNELPAEIDSLRLLEYINLWGNQLNELPISIGKLPALKELILNGNKLNSLPECLGNARNLKKLLLNNNKLREIPKKILNLPHLEIFSCEWNEFPSNTLPKI